MDILGLFGFFKKARKGLRLYNITREVDVSKLKSRKFWVTIVTGTITLFAEQLGLSPDQIQWIVTTAGAYLLGQGIADHGNGKPKV